MNTKKRECDYTKYPKVFENTWWGQSVYDIPEKNIIENRNLFVEEFNILKKKTFLKKLNNFGWLEKDDSRSFDHNESYIDKEGNYILITSPYMVIHDGQINRPEVFKFLTEKGFVVYDRLYNNNATTFIKKVKKVN